MNITNEKLKSILKSNGLNDVNFIETSETSFIEFLLKEKLVDFCTLKQILAAHFSIQAKDLTEEISIPKGIIPHTIALKYRAFAFYSNKEHIYLAMADPFNNQAIDDISIICGKKVIAFFSEPSQISFFIDRYYNQDIPSVSVSAPKSDNEPLEDQDPPVVRVAPTGASSTPKGVRPAPVVKLIDNIINSAILQSASDIHIEPSEVETTIRFRINGSLKKQQVITNDILPNISSRLKIMSGLDIADSRFPKDGGFNIINHKNVDFRISILPTIFGEKLVIRLIYKHELNFDTNSLGFSDEEYDKIKRLLKIPNGAILVTGPTGSGKTTTLSGFLAYLNKEDINITTVEDPVEKVMPGINHVSINSKIGLDFSLVLRHILRQDPDIIMIGEIRDIETAAIVVRAAITGHLVLSTLHTNDALSTISRLTDMGIEKYLLIEAVKGIIAQRLLRRLCEYCKMPVSMPLWLERRGYKKQTLYQKAGCPKCFGTGFSGRFAIYEIVVMTDELKEDILNNNRKKSDVLQKRAVENLLLGKTSLDEIYSLII